MLEISSIDGKYSYPINIPFNLTRNKNKKIIVSDSKNFLILTDKDINYVKISFCISISIYSSIINMNCNKIING